MNASDIKKAHLNRTQIFEKAGNEEVKKDKRCWIVCQLEFIKESPPLTKVNFLKRRKWGKKYMRIDFFKVIIKDESRVIFNIPLRWIKRWILFNSDV